MMVVIVTAERKSPQPYYCSRIPEKVDRTVVLELVHGSASVRGRDLEARSVDKRLLVGRPVAGVLGGVGE
jgi:hypothetical protein